MNPVRQRIMYYTLGVVAIVAAWYFVAYTPTHLRITGVGDELAATAQQLAEYGRIVSELPSILAADRSLQAERQKLNSSLYAKSDVLALFRQLTRDAEAHNLKLVQITPPVSELLRLNEQATKNNNPLFLDITLEFEGPYARFGQFVAGLEGKPYFRDVRSCTMRSHPTSTSIDLSLSFKALLGTREETTS